MQKYIGLLFFTLIYGINTICGQGTKYEAENGILTGTLQKSASMSGYSGTGYVKGFDNSSDTLTVKFHLSQAGIYKLYIAYVALSGEKINNLRVNGSSCEIRFKANFLFKELYFSRVKLKAGQNSIGLVKNWGGVYIDYFRIEESDDAETSFVIPNQLVTPNASNETKSLYKYLLDNFTKKIHAGVMTKNYSNTAIMEDVEWLKTTTGKYPALLGFDLLNHNRTWSWFDKSQIYKEAIKWCRKNGLVTIGWHWRDPLKTTDEFYTSKTSFDVSKVSDPNSSEYKAMIADIDTIAKYIKVLQDSLVPVIFRPLHEAAGGWFWWGAKGAEPCKKLWQLMFDRLVDYHRLNNLIWVWTSNAQEGNLDWYPGNDYVDIIGMDIYQLLKGDKESQILNFNKIKEDFTGKKLITLSENGTVPDPDNLEADQAGWSWFMPWYGEHTRDGIWNTVAHWQKIMNHSYVITLDEMPDLMNYPYIGPGLSIKEQKSTDGNFRILLDQNRQFIQIISENKQLAYDVYVYDIMGRFYYQKNKNLDNMAVPVEALRNGIYLIKIMMDESSSTFKIYK